MRCATCPVETEIERGRRVDVPAGACRCSRTTKPTGALHPDARRDRPAAPRPELVTKDATIREIHHRVKNNLQTVAALLRLQARRMRLARGAAGARGGGAPGRLDRDRARDAVSGCGRVVRSTRSCGRSPGWSRRPPRHRICGSASSSRATCGELPGEVATPLAVVLNELMQNAVDHAFPEGVCGGQGSRAARAKRGSRDDGSARHGRRACPTSSRWKSRAGLGLTIVQALVTGEMGGSIEMHSDDGTWVRGNGPGGSAESRALNV